MPQHLQDWLTDQAQRRPEAPAVVLEHDTLCYGELDRWSTRLARLLGEHGCGDGDRVCVLMPKTPRAIACMLGVYKAGCVYVPLDPASPAPRLAAVIRSCGASMVLAAGPVAGKLDELRERQGFGDALRVAWLEAAAPPDAVKPVLTLGDVDACPAAVTGSGRRHDAAHILFTSGSTGVPKGVIVTHAGVIAFVEWAVRHFGLGDDDRVSGHSPLHFDLSVFDIFGALAVGGQLHLVPEKCKPEPRRMAAWIRDSKLTQWFSVPAVFTYLAKFDVLRKPDFPDLRRVMWCGEVLPTPSLAYWMERVPHASFTNLYGPTETTIASSHFTVPRPPTCATEEVPIGSGCDGEELLVLNSRMRPTRPGAVGDLYIKGVGLSPGYWNNRAATEKAFINDPVTGERMYATGDRARVDKAGRIYFAGRRDAQVKSRGYRIELGEIEAALNAVKALRESAVVAVPSRDFDGVTLCCSYVPGNGETVTSVTLRTELGRWLPSYMIPSHWKAHRSLPRNPAGKIDRKRLKEAWTANEIDTA